MNIIGLIGAKGAGKTTAFNFIKELIPDAKDIALAGFLKDVCSDIFEIPRDHFDLPEFKEELLVEPVVIFSGELREILHEYGLLGEFDWDKHFGAHIGIKLDTPRQIAQYIGTEVLRGVRESVHCDVALERAKKHNGLSVITDLRFPNEFDFFDQYAEKFIPLYIKNTAAERIAANDTHASEAHLYNLAGQAIEVSNEATLGDFKASLQKALKL